MGQVTSRVSEELEAALNRWAAEEGVQRSDLIRRILTESVDARREGRASFERSDAPGPADLARIVAKLDQQTTELDRILRRDAKRDAELVKSARDDTLGVSEARAAIVGDVVASLRAALEVLHGELVRTRDDLTALMVSLPQFQAMDGRLERIEELAGRERVKRVVNTGLGEWTWPVTAVVLAVMLLFGMLGFAGLAAVLPERWIELRYASRLLGGGDRAVCRLIDYQYGTGLTGCAGKTNGRTVIFTATAPRSVRATSR